jgi:hypothetical protein
MTVNIMMKSLIMMDTGSRRYVAVLYDGKNIFEGKTIDMEKK